MVYPASMRGSEEYPIYCGESIDASNGINFDYVDYKTSDMLLL